MTAQGNGPKHDMSKDLRDTWTKHKHRQRTLRLSRILTSSSLLKRGGGNIRRRCLRCLYVHIPAVFQASSMWPNHSQGRFGQETRASMTLRSGICCAICLLISAAPLPLCRSAALGLAWPFTGPIMRASGERSMGCLTLIRRLRPTQNIRPTIGAITRISMWDFSIITRPGNSGCGLRNMPIKSATATCPNWPASRLIRGLIKWRFPWLFISLAGGRGPATRIS